MAYDIEQSVPNDGIPVLKGFIKGGSLNVWCPFCRAWHIHGATDGVKAMKGHRVAHCVGMNSTGKLLPQSPFKDRGYYIRPFTKKELSWISDTAKSG